MARELDSVIDDGIEPIAATIMSYIFFSFRNDGMIFISAIISTQFNFNFAYFRHKNLMSSSFRHSKIQFCDFEFHSFQDGVVDFLRKYPTMHSFEKWVLLNPQGYEHHLGTVEKLGLVNPIMQKKVIKKIVWITNEVIYILPQNRRSKKPSDVLSYCLSPFVKVAFDEVFKLVLDDP